jgi:hypothetical protein
MPAASFRWKDFLVFYNSCVRKKVPGRGPIPRSFKPSAENAEETVFERRKSSWSLNL